MTINKLLILLIPVGLIILCGTILFMLNISYNNQHKMYHTQYDAEQSNIENKLDNMWKIISDKFSVNQQYFNDFKDIAKVNVNAFKPDGETWKWISTQLLQIDPNMYKEVMITIQAERLSFEQSQKKIIDVVREHNYYIIKAPNSWFIADQTPLKWEVISSVDSKEIMSTHNDSRTLNDLKK